MRMNTIELLLYAGIISVVNCWYFAVTTSSHWNLNHKIQYFYENGSAAPDSVDFKGRNVSALAYDAATDLLLFIDESNPDNSIFRVRSEMEQLDGGAGTEPVARKQNVTGVAFDPVTETLFWITDDAVWRMNVSDPRSNGYGEIFVAREEGAGHFIAIAVDSCGGHIFFVEFALHNSNIKRARFDGSEVSVVVGNSLFSPMSLAVDHGTSRLYWVDKTEKIDFNVESSDFDGNNRLVVASGTYQKPNHIAIGDHDVFWIDEQTNAIWTAPKNANKSSPKEFIHDDPNVMLRGLAIKYQISDQISKNSHCDSLKKVIEQNPDIPALMSNSFIKRNDKCMHGEFIGEKCSCIEGFEGDYCKVRDCNICQKQRSSCDKDERLLCNVTNTINSTEVNILKVPTILPIFKHAEDTIKIQKNEMKNIPPQNEDQNVPSNSQSETPAETTDIGNAKEKPRLPEKDSTEKLLRITHGDFVESLPCNDNDIKEYVIMALGGVCGFLCIVIAVLVMKVIQLKKRPRIKKRIIVNKNVTPLTARPEQQCEITIENCCNMNICETPCFEPLSTVRPKLIGVKSKKEEKQNLIDNMEQY